MNLGSGIGEMEKGAGRKGMTQAFQWGPGLEEVGAAARTGPAPLPVTAQLPPSFSCHQVTLVNQITSLIQLEILSCFQHKVWHAVQCYFGLYSFVKPHPQKRLKFYRSR